MASLKERIVKYLIEATKLVVESIAFLIPAILIGAIAGMVFPPMTPFESLAPGAITVIVFGQAMRENYCFIMENRYDVMEESEETETKLSDFE